MIQFFTLFVSFLLAVFIVNQVLFPLWNKTRLFPRFRKKVVSPVIVKETVDESRLYTETGKEIVKPKKVAGTRTPRKKVAPKKKATAKKKKK